MNGKIRKAISMLLLWGSMAGCGLANQLTAVNETSGTLDDTTIAAVLLAANGCGYEWNLPSNFPVPAVPADNCMTQAKVELGRHLFYDRRLSATETASCATCHIQEFAFADAKARPRGIPIEGHPQGELHPRNSQHLSNVAYHTRLTWANPLLKTLEVQIRGPLFGQSGPSTIVELGLAGDSYLDKLRADSNYQTLFGAAFGGGTENIKEETLRKGISAFMRSMISSNSDFDKFVRGEAGMSASALRGAALFNGEKAECFHCHGGFNFTDTSTHTKTVFEEIFFHNNGLLSADDYAALKPSERGLSDVTGNSGDEGKFRSPSLRNIGVTFPYMHDGSIACDAGLENDMDACARNALRKVLVHYTTGGKTDSGGNVHPAVDKTLIRPFTLTEQEKDDMIEFLLSLTDQEFLTNPAHANPRPGDSNFGL